MEWSKKIRRRRLNWLGHLMRLHKHTPARRALEESLQPSKKNLGRPPITWTKLIEKDLATVNIELNTNKNTVDTTVKTLEDLTADRIKWKKIVKNIMAETR